MDWKCFIMYYSTPVRCFVQQGDCCLFEIGNFKSFPCRGMMEESTSHRIECANGSDVSPSQSE